jgi:HAMP domain-containing protein
MKLLMKFNLILFLLFGTGLFLVSHFAHKFLLDNARTQVLQQAELMVESARSMREYTSQELKPLLSRVPDEPNFIRQTVPAYSATVTLARLRGNYPDYVYKEAALNPTNPDDRAVEWENDIITYFRNNPDSKEIVGERDTPTGRTLYLAHPMRSPKGCLDCHSTPDKAPAKMIATYGGNNGFGWHENEVVAAQIVSVPMKLPIGIADRAYQNLIVYLVGIFLVTLIAIDMMLYLIVIRPVRQLSSYAELISKGQTDLPELPVKGKDEIAEVTGSFNRMYRSLAKALRMLEHD